jgi:DNA-binding phage protein
MEMSIKFDVELARARATELGFNEVEWARAAGVARYTLIKFLARSRGISLDSVEAILKPLGLTAVEIQIIPPHLRQSPVLEIKP